ncbi:hypothetical protein LJR034_003981 [Caballeronia sp. LjRoot34]|uniref:hypothetical protein n=1 Tax=Caballeronia sp. LjRoot34 TaxID=3342325 RepID=UPI003ECD6E1E
MLDLYQPWNGELHLDSDPVCADSMGDYRQLFSSKSVFANMLALASRPDASVD